MKARKGIKSIEVMEESNTIETKTEKRKVGADDQKIKRILVPVDFSETSDYATFGAASMAKMLGSELYLIHVIENRNVYFSIVPEAKDSRLPVGEIGKMVNEKLNETGFLIEKQTGIKCHKIISDGVIDREIINYAKDIKIDLIIMGTHGISGYKEIFLGSNAQRVVTLSDIPVLTMKKEELYSEYKTILLPIDDSSHSREKVNIAGEIAMVYGSHIHILGLSRLKDESELQEIRIKLESVEKILFKKRIPFKRHLISNEDHLAKVALDYAKKYNCDLIVINTGHESKLTGVFLGAFAQQIVNHSKIPVLSVKPTEDSYIISAPGYGIS